VHARGLDDRPRPGLVGAQRHHVGRVADVQDAEDVQQRPVVRHAGEAEHLRDGDVDVDQPGQRRAERERRCRGEVGVGQRRGEAPAAVGGDVRDHRLVPGGVGHRGEAVGRVQPGEVVEERAGG
jgi:hypothetical protein